jgi:hypothetical protein
MRIACSLATSARIRNHAFKEGAILNPSNRIRSRNTLIRATGKDPIDIGI